MEDSRKVREVSLLRPPLSPCSYGCLPCNIHCFAAVVKKDRMVREYYQGAIEKGFTEEEAAESALNYDRYLWGVTNG